MSVDVGFGLLLAVLCLVAGVHDARTRRIPNWCNLALALTGLLHGLAVYHTLRWLPLALVCATATILVFVAMGWLIGRLVRTASIGWGDVKFVAASSIWVGIDGGFVVLLIASLLAILWALLRMPWRGFDLRERFAFGPMLGLSLVMVFLVTIMAHRT